MFLMPLSSSPQLLRGSEPVECVHLCCCTNSRPSEKEAAALIKERRRREKVTETDPHEREAEGNGRRSKVTASENLITDLPVWKGLLCSATADEGKVSSTTLRRPVCERQTERNSPCELQRGRAENTRCLGFPASGEILLYAVHFIYNSTCRIEWLDFLHKVRAAKNTIRNLTLKLMISN